MKFFNIAAATLGLAMTFSASAHISLEQSTPTQEAMLMQSPEQISLNFSGEVRLVKLMINNESNEPVNFDFKPSTAPSNNFKWPLPSLEQGNYTVKWMVLGDDGHKMSGEYGFMLHKMDSNQKGMHEQSATHSAHSN